MHEEKKDCERKERVPFVIDTLEHFIFHRMRNKESISMSVHGRVYTSIPIWTIDKIQSIFFQHNFGSDAFYTLRRRKKAVEKTTMWKTWFSFTLVFLYRANSFVRGKREKAYNLVAKPSVLKCSLSLVHTMWKETVGHSINAADSKKKWSTHTI